jgi:LPXTG-motif cell wall-anchored protein
MTVRLPVKLLLTTLLTLLPFAAAQACPSCFGDPDSPMTDGMNAAVLVLLGITGSMLVSLGVFFLYLRKRWVALNARFRNLMN